MRCHASSAKKAVHVQQNQVASLLDEHLRGLGNLNPVNDEGVLFCDTAEDTSDSGLGEFNA